MVKEKEWFKAIRNGHVSVIINLLNALKDRRPHKIQNLVKQLHSVDGTQSTALHLSCQYNHCELVRILLLNGADPNTLDQSGCTALHMAAWNGNEEICDIIMKSSQIVVKVDTKNCAGETALHLASQHGHDKVVETLLEMGARPDILNTYDQTALILACQFGRKDVVAALVDRMDSQEKEVLDFCTTENSPMHMATHNGHAQVVSLLIDSGFPVNAKTPGGTCLHEAVRWNRVSVVQALVEHGIDETICNSDEKTALELLDRNNQKVGITMKKMITDYTERKLVVTATPQLKTRPRADDLTADGVYEMEETSAVDDITAVLFSTKSESEAPLPPPPPEFGSEEAAEQRPSTPEMMRRMSSKYRKKFEKICCGDDSDPELETVESSDESEDEAKEDGVGHDDVFVSISTA